MRPQCQCHTVTPLINPYTQFSGKFKRGWDKSNGLSYSYVASFCNNTKYFHLENGTNF